MDQNEMYNSIVYSIITINLRKKLLLCRKLEKSPKSRCIKPLKEIPYLNKARKPSKGNETIKDSRSKKAKGTKAKNR